jgi:hypothetical protein
MPPDPVGQQTERNLSSFHGKHTGTLCQAGFGDLLAAAKVNTGHNIQEYQDQNLPQVAYLYNGPSEGGGGRIW